MESLPEVATDVSQSSHRVPISNWKGGQSPGGEALPVSGWAHTYWRLNPVSFGAPPSVQLLQLWRAWSPPANLEVLASQLFQNYQSPQNAKVLFLGFFKKNVSSPPSHNNPKEKFQVLCQMRIFKDCIWPNTRDGTSERTVGVAEVHPRGPGAAEGGQLFL